MPSGASPTVGASSPTVPPSATPNPSPSSAPVRENLGGVWAFGTTNEPPAGSVESCQQALALTDDMGSARLVIDDCAGILEHASGTFEGTHLRLEGSFLTEQGDVPVTYDMVYDPSTQHFHGTRNGVTYWMARRTGMCVSPSILCATVLRGTVYEETGGRVPGVRVTIRSLNPSNPYESTIDSISGDWAALHVPTGVLLEVTATKAGWSTRSRTKTLYPITTVGPNRLDFGGVGAPEDPDAVAYPLLPESSPTPESQTTH